MSRPLFLLIHGQPDAFLACQRVAGALGDHVALMLGDARALAERPTPAIVNRKARGRPFCAPHLKRALTAGLGSQAPTLIEVPTLAEGF